MKHMKMLKIAFMAMALSVAGMSAVSAEEKKKVSPEMAKFQSMLKGAHSAAKAAAKVGGEWRDIRWKKSKAVKVKIKGKTKKMSILAAAEAYAKMGNFKKANKLINKAVFQADMGYKQALAQKNAGPTFQ